METLDTLDNEESLDPRDWQKMRDLGHRMVDDMMDYLANVRERPIWQKMPEQVKGRLQVSLPREPEGAEATYRDFMENILPYPMGNIHPRFWGWVIGTGTPLGMLAEMLAAGMNPNLGGGDHGAVYVESQVLAWCKEMMGFPAEASGLLVSGGSMANLMGLAVARNLQTGVDIRKEGVSSDKGRFLVYCSTETHSSVLKAVELLGLGNKSLRQIPVNSDFEIDLAQLRATLETDLQEGHRPFCIVANAGTVNTGAFDDIASLLKICREHQLWLHIDGAFGALARLLPEYESKVAGIEAADSIAFDLHKWLYVPYEAGCILVRRFKDHRDAFKLVPNYLLSHARGIASGPEYFSNLGFELSRGFKALKVWMSLKEHGIDKYARLIRQNIHQARYLAGLIEAVPELELLAPVPLNVVCFRFTARDLNHETQNRVNQEIVMRLHEQGIAAPSFTILDGKYAIRVAITNHRSRKQDFDLLVKESVRLGQEVVEDEPVWVQ